MLGYKVPASRRKRDEGEKPFWISYADLMTAMMVLFLVVMSVSLLVVVIILTDTDLVPKKWLDYEKDIHGGTFDAYWYEILENERLKASLDKDAALRQQRTEQMQDILTELQKEAAKIKSCNVDLEQKKDSLIITFSKGLQKSSTNNELIFEPMFDEGKYRLSVEDKKCIRDFMPVMYEELKHKAWFNKVAVEGFTSSTGTYLTNLNLSLQRAQQVVCTVMAKDESSQILKDDVLLFVQQKFFVGGFSFNTPKASDEESRRVELRLDFKTLDEYRSELEEPESTVLTNKNGIGICAQQ